jgi:hypothetical protein
MPSFSAAIFVPALGWRSSRTRHRTRSRPNRALLRSLDSRVLRIDHADEDDLRHTVGVVAAVLAD